MPPFANLLDKAVAVGASLLGIAVGTIATAKRALAEMAKKKIIDPLVDWNFDRERSRGEARQAEIDAELLGILEQVRRDGGFSQDTRDRYDALERESDRIARKIGPRQAAQAAPDDYDIALVDPHHMHRLEWHVGQATDKLCAKCGLPMLLQLRRDQMSVAYPDYFWGCTGWYLDRADPLHCANKERVTNADLGALLRRDNEALAMDRAEMCRRAFDRTFSRRVGDDLRQLRGRTFPAYRCPVHGLGMVLARKRVPLGKLDVWYLKCPSPVSHNGSRGCRQIVKLKTVAQVLAVRQIGTGEIF